MTVWQLLVGEAWHELMTAGIFATNGWIAIYFLSYTIVMTLLITNLLIGIFVGAHGKVEEAHQRGGNKVTTMDMQSMLIETSGGKRFIYLSHPEGPEDPVSVRKVFHGGYHGRQEITNPMMQGAQGTDRREEEGSSSVVSLAGTPRGKQQQQQQQQQEGEESKMAPQTAESSLEGHDPSIITKMQATQRMKQTQRLCAGTGAASNGPSAAVRNKIREMQRLLDAYSATVLQRKQSGDSDAQQRETKEEAQGRRRGDEAVALRSVEFVAAHLAQAISDAGQSGRGGGGGGGGGGMLSRGNARVVAYTQGDTDMSEMSV